MQMKRANLIRFVVLLALLALWPVKGLAENQNILLLLLINDYICNTVESSE